MRLLHQPELLGAGIRKSGLDPEEQLRHRQDQLVLHQVAETGHGFLFVHLPASGADQPRVRTKLPPLLERPQEEVHRQGRSEHQVSLHLVRPVVVAQR